VNEEKPADLSKGGLSDRKGATKETGAGAVLSVMLKGVDRPD